MAQLKLFSTLFQRGIKPAGGALLRTTAALKKPLARIVSGGQSVATGFGRGAGSVSKLGGKVAGLGVVVGGAGVGAGALFKKLRQDFGQTGEQIQRGIDLELVDKELDLAERAQGLKASPGGGVFQELPFASEAAGAGATKASSLPLFLLAGGISVAAILLARKKKKKRK